MMPADFILDESGHILVACYGKDAGDHLPVSEIERVLVPAALEPLASSSP